MGKEKPCNGWKWSTLGKECDIKIGGTPKRGNSSYFNGNNLWVKVSDLNDGIILDTQEKISDQAVKDSNVKLIKKGTILLCFKLSLGKKAIAGTDLYTNEAIAALEIRDDSSLLRDFLYLCLNKINFYDYCNLAAKGNCLNSKILSRIVISVPPIEIQEEIVTKIQSQLYLIEKIKNESEKCMESSEKYCASVISSFFDNLDESNSTLVSLNDICKIRSGQIDPKIEEFKKLPHIYGKSIESGTGKLLEYNTIEEDKVTSGKYLFRAGDVLYSKLRPYLKKVVYVDFNGLCSADMYPLEVDRTKINPHWLVILLLSEDFTNYAIQQSSRARMPKLNRDQLCSWQFFLPSLDVQNEKVKRFQELMRINSNIKEIEQLQLEAINQLPASILNEVFGKYEIPERV